MAMAVAAVPASSSTAATFQEAVAPSSSSSSAKLTSSFRAVAFLSLIQPCNSQSSFFGVGLSEAGARSLHPNAKRRSISLPAVRARNVSAGRTIEVEVDKPLGLTLGQKTGGGVVISAVDGKGNAAKAGLKAGDQVIYTSSFFGDELWPADKLGFTKTAIQAKADSVYFVVSRGAEVNVKKLAKRPAPPRFGRKLTEAQKARATHICLDCGYIYTLAKPFEEQPVTFECPQCSASKKRFARYDAQTGRTAGGSAPPITVILGVLMGAAAVAALVVYGLQ